MTTIKTLELEDITSDNKTPSEQNTEAENPKKQNQFRI